MRYLFLSILIGLASFCVKAQNLVVDSFKVLTDNNEILENPVYDSNDYICALIKVYVTDLPDLGFSSLNVIDPKNIKYQEGYYKVYVVDGTSGLEILHDDYFPVKINFMKDFGIGVEGGYVYELRLLTSGKKIKPTQTVVFHVMPGVGTIDIDGEQYILEKGTLQKEFLPGTHHYVITSDCYHPYENDFIVTDISEAQNVTAKLEPIMCDVDIELLTNAKNAKVIVDNRKKGAPGKMQLPMGWRIIRVSADNWKDFSKREWIEQGKVISVKLEPKTYFPVVINAKGFKNPKLYINNKEVPGWQNNGKPIMVKGGKQYVSVIDQVMGKYGMTDGQNKSRYITFVPDMAPIEI